MTLKEFNEKYLMHDSVIEHCNKSRPNDMMSFRAALINY